MHTKWVFPVALLTSVVDSVAVTLLGTGINCTWLLEQKSDQTVQKMTGVILCLWLCHCPYYNLIKIFLKFFLSIAIYESHRCLVPHIEDYQYSGTVHTSTFSYSSFLESDTQIYDLQYFMNLTWVVTLPLSNFRLH